MEIYAGTNSKFSLLFQKKSEIKRVSTYRPISLAKGPYKIILKVLSNRLKDILHDIIDAISSLLFKGKNSVMVANEYIEELQEEKEERLQCQT